MGKPHAPLYHTLSHIPLLVWHPNFPGKGQHVAATTQTVDLYATVLELLGLPIPDTPNIHSRSFAPVLAGQNNHRECAIYGYNNKRVGITAGEWTLLRYHDPDAAPAVIFTQQVEQTDGFGIGRRQRRPFAYPDLEAGHFIPGIETPVWRMPLPVDYARHHPTPRDDLLFHNPSDPDQLHNVATAHPEVIAQLEGLLRQQMQRVQAPPEQWLRLGLAT